MPALLIVWAYTDETLHIFELGHHMVVWEPVPARGRRWERWDPGTLSLDGVNWLKTLTLCQQDFFPTHLHVCLCTFLLPALPLHCASFQSSHRYFSFVFVCLNICAHHQDPLLYLNSEVTQLSLTWKKCLAHPLEQGGMAWRVPVVVMPWYLAFLPLFCLVCGQTESAENLKTTCNISALGMALINDGQVKRQWTERNFWGYWRSVALFSFLLLLLSFHFLPGKAENMQRNWTVLCHFLNLYSDVCMIKHTKKPHPERA